MSLAIAGTDLAMTTHRVSNGGMPAKMTVAIPMPARIGQRGDSQQGQGVDGYSEFPLATSSPTGHRQGYS
jgi:hypothetical protein